MRGSTLTIIILVLGIGLLATVLLLGNHGLEWSIIREGIQHVLPLTEEVQPDITVLQQTITIQPGQVYRITNTEYGPTLTTTGSRLIETLNMTNITLQGGDIISWHEFAVYVPAGDVGSNYVYLGDITPFNGSYTMLFKTVGFPSDSRNSIVFNYIAGYTGYMILYINNDGYMGCDGRDPWTYDLYNFPSTSTGILSASSEFGLAYDYNTNTSYYVDIDEQVSLTTIKHGFGYKITLGNDLDWDTLISEEPRQQDPSIWDYFIFYDTLVDPEDIQYMLTTKTMNKAPIFFDATWYNGTHYLGLDGTAGTPSGNIHRVPATETWLWLIKNAESDGYLHLKYVPAGAIFRIIVNGVTYEWRVPEEGANAAGLIEDYPIDITALFGQTLIENATIQLIYPSDRVRIYAPTGFTVKLSGSFAVEKAVGDDGYVDVGVPEGSYTLELLATQQTEPVVNIDVIGDSATVIVTDNNNVAIPDAQVVVSDGDNIVAQGITDDLGKYTFTLPDNVNSLSISVIGLKDGVYYTGVETVQLVEPGGGAQLPTESLSAENLPSNSSSSAIAVVLLLLAVIMIAIAVGERGK